MGSIFSFHSLDLSEVGYLRSYTKYDFFSDIIIQFQNATSTEIQTLMAEVPSCMNQSLSSMNIFIESTQDIYKAQYVSVSYKYEKCSIKFLWRGNSQVCHTDSFHLLIELLVSSTKVLGTQGKTLLPPKICYNI